MKTFVLLAVFALFAGALALTEEQKAKGQEHAKACITEIGASEEAVKKLREGDFTNKDEKIQCFANCFLEKAGLMKDGEFQESVAIEKLSTNVDKAKVEEVVAKCKDTKGADKCETAFKLYECYHTNKAELA